MNQSNSAISLEKLVKVYIKIREERVKLKQDFTDRDHKLDEQMETIKEALLRHCKEHDVTSVKTSEGLFYRSVQHRYWTSDWESMHAFVLEHAEPALLEKRIHQAHMKSFLEDNPDVTPKGLNSDSKYTVSVRKK